MAEEEIGLRATLKDRRQTAAGLREIKGDVENVGQAAQRSGRLAAVGAKGFDGMRRSGRLAATAIKVGFGVALTAGYGLVKLLQGSFGEAREAQKVGATTAQIIKTTGKAANVSARQVGNLSTRLSNLAGVDDELIQSGANQLLTFKAVRNELGKGNKIFDRATTAALNLSKVPGMGDMVGSAKMLGKALQDPEKGLTALTKAGVTFTQDQKDQIANMVKQGNLLGAQKMILHEVEGQVNGVAKAQATWGDKASVVVGNVKERIGTSLLPVLDGLEKWFVKKGAKSLDHYLDIFDSKGVPALQRFSKQAVPVANRILPKIADTIGTVGGLLKDAAPYAEDLLNAFTGMPGWAKKAIIGGALAGVAGQKTGAFSLLGSLGKGASGVGGLVASSKPVPVIIVKDLSGITGGGLPGVVPTGGGVKGAINKPGALPLGGLLPILPGAVPDTIAPPKMGSAFDMMKDAGVFLDPVNKTIQAIQKDINGSWANPFLPLARSTAALLPPLQDSEVHTRGLGTSLDKVGRTKVAPNFTTPGLADARGAVDQYKGQINKVARPFTTHFNADTSAADHAISALAVRASNLATRKFNLVFGGLTGRATGGPVEAGTPYIVGERGPEVITPGTNSYVTPNHALRAVAPQVASESADLGARPVIHTQVMIDKRVLVEAWSEGVSDQTARA